MIQCLLITPEMRKTKPHAIVILDDYGPVTAIFDNHKNVTGDHCVIEGAQEDIAKWLAPFDGIALGEGSPMFQQFTIVHVKDSLVAKAKGIIA